MTKVHFLLGDGFFSRYGQPQLLVETLGDGDGFYSIPR